MEEINEQMLDNVEKLVLDYGVSHKEIIKSIHDRIFELSKALPKFEVLYNDTYGGYGLSKEFVEYIKERQTYLDDLSHRYSKKYRREAAKYIVPFGKFVLDKYPVLKDILIIYHQCKWNEIAYEINSLYYSEKRLHSL